MSEPHWDRLVMAADRVAASYGRIAHSLEQLVELERSAQQEHRERMERATLPPGSLGGI